MINFISVSMRNFFSYGNAPTLVQLNNQGTTMIVGENLDNTTDGKGANGTGKTVVVNAIAYAIFDKPVSKIKTKDGLVNNRNNQNMFVTLCFEKSGATYEVTRARKVKTKGEESGNWVRVLKDGVDITRDSSNNTNDMLIDIIGMPYELFVQIVVFSATKDSFLELPAKQATEVIESLFGITELSNKAAILKLQIKEHVKPGIEREKIKIEALEGEHKRYDSQLENTKRRVTEWDVELAVDIADLTSALDVLVEGEKTFEIIEPLLEEYQDKLSTQSLAVGQVHQQTAALARECDDWTAAHTKECNVEITTIVNNYKSAHAAAMGSASAERKQVTNQFDIEYNAVREKHNSVIVDLKNSLQTSINDVSSNINVLAGEFARTSKNVIELENEHGHLADAKCPYCLQSFADATVRIGEIEANIEAGKESLTDFDEATLVLGTELSALNDRMEDEVVGMERAMSVELEANREARSDVVAKLDDAAEAELNKITTEQLMMVSGLEKNRDIAVEERKQECRKATVTIEFESEQMFDDLETQLRKLSDGIGGLTPEAINTHRNKIIIESDKLEGIKNTANPFNTTLADLIGGAPPIINYDTLNELETTLVHQNFLLKLLTRKDSFVRATLLNKNLPFLNARLAGYLNELGLPHKVEFTPNLTANISQFGKPLEFGNLSNGQGARVNLALSFAFRDVLQQMHTPINICVLDEVLDVGLCPVGVAAAARLLKQKARDEKLCMYVISHRDELDNTFDRRLVVQLEKGFSYIQQEH